ncbi:MAG: hypothetical protein DI570_02065 [Phenylobacterium zucineum]|nr:MAG: hypothetical protein DI570_02065 [Phenylobacterium zucineum]
MSRFPRRPLLVCGAAAAAFVGIPAAALPVLSNTTPQVSAGGSQPVIQGTSGTVRVDLNAPRTIIDWQSFNLTAGEQAQFLFDQRNWVVLNRVQSGAININGQVTGYQAANASSPLPNVTSGNVWFYSPQGVVFGPNARVDVGGLLATSAAPDVTGFLDAANLNVTFTGSGTGGSVDLGAGSQFAGKGYLAFVAPIVNSAAGAVVNAGDYGTAAYAAVDSYEIRFRPAFNNDLTFFTFIVPNGAAGTPHDSPLNLAGQTTGANVYLMAISRAQLTSVLINAPGLLVGQSSFDNYGQVTITTGRNITEGQVAESSTPVPGARSGLVRLGSIDAMGNVNIAVTGRFGTSDLTANRIRAGQGLFIAVRDMTVGAGGVSSGDRGVNFGGTRIDALGVVTIPQLTARTTIDIRPGAFQAGGPDGLPTLRLGSLTAGGAVGFLASTLDVQSITAGSIASSTENETRAGTLTGATDVLVASSTSLTVDRIQAGALSRLTFVDFTLTGGVTAQDVVLRMLDPAGAVLGGSATGARVSNAEFQRFSVRGSLSVYAGIEGQFPVSNDLFVDDLDIDPTKVPELRLFAKTDHDVVVRGVMTPTADGVKLQIGESRDVTDTVWRPDRIIVTGALGSAEGDAIAGFTEVKAFGAIKLTATKDILIGSERFIELISEVPAAEIDISMGLPAGVAPVEDEIGRLFVVGASLDAYASDRIVQQNTAPLGQQGGFFLTGKDVAATDPLLILGGAQAGEVFGALQIADGVVTTGSTASASTRIVRAEGDTSIGRIRINGCQLGIGCATFTPANQFRVQQFRPAAPRAAIDPPVLTPPPPIDDDERQAESVVTGAGNEEIWRKTK